MRSFRGRMIWVGLLTALSTACGGNGGDDGPPVAVTKYYAYVTDWWQSRVVAYSIDPTTGAWRAKTGPSGSTGTGPGSVAVDPSGKYAYVTNMATNNVSVYSVDAATGGLTEISGSPCSVAGPPLCVTFAPSGSYAYVVEQLRQVSAYDVRVGYGLLVDTGIAGSPYIQGTWGWSHYAKADPAGHGFLYVANDEGVFGYSIASATGVLNPIPGSPFHWGGIALAMDPQSRFLYVVNNAVSAYTIAPTTGELTAITGSPFIAGSAPYSVAVDPAGKFAYVANFGSDEITCYSINSATGALTYVGSVVRAGTAPQHVVVDPTGKFVYVANTGTADVGGYAINPSTGMLTSINGFPLSLGAGTMPVAIAVIKITL